MKTQTIVLFFLVLIPLSLQAQGFFSNSTTGLSQAQGYYLSGDFKKMAQTLRDILEQNPNDSLITENALSLLDKAYGVIGGGNMPADWHLPDEIKTMNISVKYRDDGTYTFRVFGQTLHEKTISQLQVVQFPDHIVLDKEAQTGSWSDTSQIDTLDHVYELQAKRGHQPVPSGLYLLNLTLTDGTQTKGWFILTDAENSTSVPRVFSPAADEVFKTGNPIFTWENFVSTQYKNFEKRSMWVGISRNEPPQYKWDEVWGHYALSPTYEQITIDSHGDQGSLSTLNNGNYIFFIDYHEKRKFGDLDITRDSFTSRDFKVAQ